MNEPARPRRPRRPAPAPSSSRRPDVVVDFECRDGVFFLSVRNVGGTAARAVRVDFAPGFTGFDGKKDVAGLPLFRDLTYLAPDRRIETFLDTSRGWFRREQPTRIKVRVRYRDARGRPYEDRFEHNLEVYRELGYVERGATREGGS